ncbi:hypothetical protein CEB3_c10800 [Peptococcaceae bacterium CEB3]|nr:hypothetical protein CEB3_c10800 [Peptococcaceae bacterium CEB3]
MSKAPEQELDEFIDSLNMEHRPVASRDPDTAELQSLVRMVKGLRGDAEPSREFVRNLARKLPEPYSTGRKHRRVILPWAALVAGLLAVVILLAPWSFGGNDPVQAMEQTVSKLQSYHGVLEKITTNATGRSQVFQRLEIWSQGNHYAVRAQDGSMTVNNGKEHWQVDPKDKEVILLPLYPDQRAFDLREEAAKAVRYPHKTVGRDPVAGRSAERIEISPPGGLPYFLWVDSETHLPVRLQTAMQNAVQTTYTFISFEPNVSVPASVFAYKPPQGYKIVDRNYGQTVANPAEAEKISGITPLEPKKKPQEIYARAKRVVFAYGDTVVSETVPDAPFVLSPGASLGQADGGQLEVLKDSLRWRQSGLEIKAEGPQALELAGQLTKITLPQAKPGAGKAAEVQVPVDLAVVKNNQKQVDAGSSPWQLDPLQVAQTFVALKMSPGGIKGNPPIAYSSLKLVVNTGVEAVVRVDKGPIRTVYLKRLVRQDATGIWTVVGYDPA